MNKLKQSPVIRFFYNLPGARTTYHFLWAWAGAGLRKQPGKKIFIIGVTGTKGKTTTLELLNAMLEAAGKRTALLSSLRVKIGDASEKNQMGNSMPGHGYIASFLERAIAAKCSYALIEVTSQGVALHRHRFIGWNIGVLTNLAPEHIESHGSFENYRKAKLDFLKYVVKRGGKVFLNREDGHADFFAGHLTKAALGASGDRSGARPLMYATDDESVRDFLSGIGPMQSVHGRSAQAFLSGDFNAQNIAAAAAVAKELGVADAAIRQALLEFKGVPGRMEFVTAGPYTAVVDYAHTPDSLEAVYKTVKPAPSHQYPHPRLICVLGAAGGGRDRWKRPEMGAIAARYCDEIILTDEDPYDEDPRKIVEEIESGIVIPAYGRETSASQRVRTIMNRAEAVAAAVDMMREGDVTIGTGKGSEDWIHVERGEKISWNERAAFEAELLKKNKKAPSEK